MSGDAFSWVRFLAKSLHGAMVPSGLGHGPQRRRHPAGLLLLGWTPRCMASLLVGQVPRKVAAWADVASSFQRPSCDVQLPGSRILYVQLCLLLSQVL